MPRCGEEQSADAPKRTYEPRINAHRRTLRIMKYAPEGGGGGAHHDFLPRSPSTFFRRTPWGTDPVDLWWRDETGYMYTHRRGVACDGVSLSYGLCALPVSLFGFVSRVIIIILMSSVHAKRDSAPRRLRGPGAFRSGAA